MEETFFAILGKNLVIQKADCIAENNRGRKDRWGKRRKWRGVRPSRENCIALVNGSSRRSRPLNASFPRIAPSKGQRKVRAHDPQLEGADSRKDFPRCTGKLLSRYFLDRNPPFFEKVSSIVLEIRSFPRFIVNLFFPRVVSNFSRTRLDYYQQRLVPLFTIHFSKSKPTLTKQCKWCNKRGYIIFLALFSCPKEARYRRLAMLV